MLLDVLRLDAVIFYTWYPLLVILTTASHEPRVIVILPVAVCILVLLPTQDA